MNRVAAGAVAGAAAGCAATGVMYVAEAVVGTRPLPELLQEPILGAMPGVLFGLLIDNLQHLGKVLEEAGLVLMMIVVSAGLGVLYGRHPRRGLPLLAAAGVWLLVVLALLPAAGQGLLGLVGGPAVPFVWALVMVVQAVVLQLAYGILTAPVPDAAADPDRRRLLRLVPGGIALAGLGVAGARLLPGWYSSVAHPPEAGAAGPTPDLTPTGSFYLVSKNFTDPVVAERGWQLRVRGLVAHPQALDTAALRALPRRVQIMTLECISNDVGGEQISTGEFAGVSLRDVVGTAQPTANAAWITFRARDGFTESMPLAMAQGAPEILVGYELNGAPLPDRHGFPARILIPGHYGMKGPKWLDEIELAASENGGFWEAQGWSRQAVVKTMARFDLPRDGYIVRAGAVSLSGVAFAGTRGIEGVEWSADGGRSWLAAQVRPPPSPLSWVHWSATWTPPREGPYKLSVRATDGNGELQTATRRPSYPDGSSGYHSIRVSVARNGA